MPIWIPGKSIKTQLISLLFGLTAVATILLGYLAIRAVIQSGNRAAAITDQAMTQRAEQFLVQAVTSTAAKNSLLFADISQKTTVAAQAAQNILQNPAKFSDGGWHFDTDAKRLPTGQYTSSKDAPGSIFLPSESPVPAALKRELEITSYLDYLYPQILASEPNAVALYFNSARNTSRYYPNIGVAELVPPNFDLTTQEFFSVANPTNDPVKTTKWTSVYDDPAGHGLLITAAHPLYLANGSFAGTVGMDIALTSIAKNIKDYSPIDSSYAFLIDQKGRAIALPDQGYRDLLGRSAKKDEFGTDLTGVKGDFAAVLQAMRSGNKGFTTTHVGSGDLYVAYAPVHDAGFSLGIVARRAALLQVVSQLQAQVQQSTRQTLYYQILPTSLGILLVVWLFGFVYIRLLTDPIKLLTAKTARISGGHLDIEPATVQVKNEIAQLADSFNTMVADLRLSRKKIDQQNKELLHTEQTRLRAAVNSLNVGFIMTGGRNEVIMMNGLAKQILAYPEPQAGSAARPAKQRDNWTTATIDEQLGPDIAFMASIKQALATAKPVERKEVLFRGRSLHVYVAPIHESNQSLGAVALIEDITEVTELARAKDEFFSIASHELRTPITAVRGNAALLAQVYSTKLHDRDFDEMVGDIHDASVRLIAIVNDFLDASRLEQGRIKFDNQSFNIEETIKAVVYELQAVAQEKGNQLKIGSGVAHLPGIYADKNRVKQIIYNLVGNAMKFTDKGSITIDVTLANGQLKTLVTDTGPGISAQDQALLFRKFQQVGPTRLTRDASHGTGLGLYISKLLAEQMGGAVTLEHSQLGKGTTFSFSLPILGLTQSSPPSLPH